MSHALTVDVHFDPWLRDILFAAADLLSEVERADEVLVTDAILAAAAKLRQTIEQERE